MSPARVARLSEHVAGKRYKTLLAVVSECNGINKGSKLLLRTFNERLAQAPAVQAVLQAEEDASRAALVPVETETKQMGEDLSLVPAEEEDGYGEVAAFSARVNMEVATKQLVAAFCLRLGKFQRLEWSCSVIGAELEYLLARPNCSVRGPGASVLLPPVHALVSMYGGKTPRPELPNLVEFLTVPTRAGDATIASAGGSESVGNNLHRIVAADCVSRLVVSVGGNVDKESGSVLATVHRLDELWAAPASAHLISAPGADGSRVAPLEHLQRDLSASEFWWERERHLHLALAILQSYSGVTESGVAIDALVTMAAELQSSACSDSGHRVSEHMSWNFTNTGKSLKCSLVSMVFGLLLHPLQGLSPKVYEPVLDQIIEWVATVIVGQAGQTAVSSQQSDLNSTVRELETFFLRNSAPAVLVPVLVRALLLERAVGEDAAVQRKHLVGLLDTDPLLESTVFSGDTSLDIVSNQDIVQRLINQNKESKWTSTSTAARAGSAGKVMKKALLHFACEHQLKALIELLVARSGIKKLISYVDHDGLGLGLGLGSGIKKLISYVDHDGKTPVDHLRGHVGVVQVAAVGAKTRPVADGAGAAAAETKPENVARKNVHKLRLMDIQSLVRLLTSKEATAGTTYTRQLPKNSVAVGRKSKPGVAGAAAIPASAKHTIDCSLSVPKYYLNNRYYVKPAAGGSDKLVMIDVVAISYGKLTHRAV